jgi:hypothetical protein
MGQVVPLNFIPITHDIYLKNIFWIGLAPPLGTVKTNGSEGKTLQLLGLSGFNFKEVRPLIPGKLPKVRMRWGRAPGFRCG